VKSSADSLLADYKVVTRTVFETTCAPARHKDRGGGTREGKGDRKREVPNESCTR